MIPDELLNALELREGDQVQAVVRGKTLRFARINKFLALRGTLANDPEFDRAMEWIDSEWRKWTTLPSA